MVHTTIIHVSTWHRHLSHCAWIEPRTTDIPMVYLNEWIHSGHATPIELADAWQEPTKFYSSAPAAVGYEVNCRSRSTGRGFPMAGEDFLKEPTTYTASLGV